MCPGGYPIQESQNWQSAFLPGIFQGTYIDTAAHGPRQADREHPQQPSCRWRSSAASSTCCSALNRAPRSAAGSRTRNWKRASSRSNWRIGCRWRRADAFDISREPEHIRELYGPGTQARQTPHRAAAGRTRRAVRAGLARRGPAVGQPRRPRSQPPQAGQGNAIKPIGALLKDLKQRGLLEDTLVIWGGEFGRTPDGRAAERRAERRQDQRPRPQPLRLHRCGWPAAA